MVDLSRIIMAPTVSLIEVVKSANSLEYKLLAELVNKCRWDDSL